MLAVARGRRSVRFAVTVQSLLLVASLFSGVPVRALAAGPSNTGLALNGSTQYATLGSNTALRSATFTLELWFKRAAGGATQSTGTGGVTAYPLITKGRAEAETAAADVNYFFGIDGAGHLTADFEEGQAGASPSLNHPITGAGTVLASDPGWHHAAATYDGTTWNLYLDGNLDGTLLVGRPANAATAVVTAVGTSLSTAATPAPLGFFSGSIDEVRIWNSARSQAQIQASKNSEITSPATGLLGAWNLNEGTGTSLADSSGNIVTGATVASPAWVPGFFGNSPVTIALDSPAAGATGTSLSPTLSATPTDPANGALQVSFYGRPWKSGAFALIGTNTGVTSGSPTTTSWFGRGDGQRYEWYAVASNASGTATSPTRSFETVLGTDPVLVGAGDIAVCGSSGDEATADVLLGVQGGVFTLGDNVYPSGLLSEFNSCYGPSWGQASIKSRTRPISGNHDFGDGSNNGGGYFDYFNGAGANEGPAGPRNTGFYSYDVGAYWHVVALNTECGNAGVGCTAGSPQELWLRNDLAANAAKNVIVMIHRPFISSGISGGRAELAPLWADFHDYGVDLVLAGHDHHYEVFNRLSRTGTAVDTVNGVREIIVGTGGASETGSSATKTGSLVRQFNTFGVFRLALHQTSYDWTFLAAAGETFTDSGTSPVNAGSNAVPVIDSVTISPSNPTTNQTLTASVTAHDPDGTTPTVAYQWTKNGTDLAGATGSTLNLATAGNGDRGDVIGVRVTASDGLLTTAPSSAAPVTVANSTPSVTVTVSSPSPTTDDTLTATATPSDADGDTVALDYVWTVDGNVVSGATSATLDLSVAGHGDRSQIVAVEVTPSDASTSGTTASASATVANSAPVASVVLSPATPGTAATVTATVTANDADGDAIDLTYVWRNGATVVRSTGPTVTTSDALDLSVEGNGDAGDVITVTVTPSDGDDQGDDATDAVGVDNQAPVVDSVSINPIDPTTSQTLTASASARDPDGGSPTIAYQWTRNGTDIAGATDPTLDLSAAGYGDRGDVIAVRVTASDGALTSDPVTSDDVTVANSAPSATVSVAPDPAGTAGTLTATAAAADADSDDTVTLTYVWTVDGTTVRTTAATTDLTDTLDLAVAGNGDPGQTVAVSVTPSDGSVTGSPVSDSATVETKALTFNGTSQYVTFGAAPDLNASTFTLETWFRWTGGGAGANTGTGGIASATGPRPPRRGSPRPVRAVRRRPGQR